MKRKLYNMVAIALATGLIACTETLDEGNAGGDRPQGAVSLTATVDGYTPLAATRTQVGGMADDGALLMEWSVGDCIGVFAASTSNAPFVSANTEPAASTVFTGTMEGGDLPQYAYYPYAEEATDLTAIPVSIPTEQMYRDESSVAQYDVKAASSIAADASGGYSVQFRQMAALVRFEIDLSGVPDLANDELLMDITIHPSNADGTVPMTGEFTYDLTNLDAGLQPGEATMDGITLYFAIPPTARETAVAYAVVAPGAHAGEEWTCTFTTDRQQGVFTTTALCDFEAGKYYTVPLTAEVLDNNETTYEPVPEEETANCYIVTEAGEHSFKATVIGNGAKGIIPGAGFHTETPYINPKSAKLLWSSVRNFVSDVRLENGNVIYQTNQATGNAVIAVYSEPDCQGDILWSWHIWGTSGIPEDEVYTNQAGATFKVMDRTLGAIRRGDSRAVLYQWGRKDPFPGTPSSPYYYYVEGQTEVNIQKTFPTFKSDEATILDAIRYPDQMISANDNSVQNWLAEPNFYLWGDYGRELPDDLSDPLCVAGWNNQKTIYDPSPVGYRVANIFTFSNFVNTTDGNTVGETNTERLASINYVRATNTDCWYFKKDENDTEGADYPAIGVRYGSTGSTQYSNSNHRNDGGRWWSAEAFTASDGSVNACYLITDVYADSNIGTHNEIQTYAKTASLRDAFGVRCVREDTAEENN